MTLPSNFNDVVNKTIADKTMSPHQKAYRIGAMFLPADEMFAVLNDQHLPPTPTGEFGLWEVEE